MAVAHDVATESHSGTTGSASEAFFDISHNPVGVPTGVGAAVFTISATKTVTSVTYDGETVPEITAAAAVDTATEPGRVDLFYLGAGVNPTDPATMRINRTNNAVVMYAVCFTIFALGDTEIYVPSIVLLQENGAYTEQSVDDGSPGTNSLRYAGGYYGGATPAPQGASSTQLHTIDFSAFGCSFCRETTAGQGARSVGFTQATSDDRAGSHFAVREVVAATLLPHFSRTRQAHRRQAVARSAVW